jgi:hypothetical protein
VPAAGNWLSGLTHSLCCGGDQTDSAPARWRIDGCSVNWSFNGSASWVHGAPPDHRGRYLAGFPSMASALWEGRSIIPPPRHDAVLHRRQRLYCSRIAATLRWTPKRWWTNC